VVKHPGLILYASALIISGQYLVMLLEESSPLWKYMIFSVISLTLFSLGVFVGQL
jgi:hypothetical protein